MKQTSDYEQYHKALTDKELPKYTGCDLRVGEEKEDLFIEVMADDFCKIISYLQMKRHENMSFNEPPSAAQKKARFQSQKSMRQKSSK